MSNLYKYNGILPLNLNFIFYHIEKCGGTSLRYIFYDYFKNIYNEEQIFMPEKFNNTECCFTFKNIDEIIKKSEFKYDDLRVILSHLNFYDFNFKNIPLKITFIRDPVSRVISHYYFFYYPKTNIHLIDLSKNDFESYCKCQCSLLSNKLGLIVHNIFNIKNIEVFTFIGKLEYIEEGLTILNKILNKYYSKQYTLEYKKMNENKKKEIKEYDKLKELILPYCELDYKVYHYFDKYFVNKDFFKFICN